MNIYATHFVLCDFLSENFVALYTLISVCKAVRYIMYAYINDLSTNALSVRQQ